MKKKIAVLAGDGIGPEVMDEALKVLKKVEEKFGHEFEVEEALVGGAAYDEYGSCLPEETVKVCEESDAILYGSVGGPKWDHLPLKERPEVASLLDLRKHFGLFANFRPARIYEALTGVSSLKEERIKGGLDIVVVRELSSGIYFGEHRGDEMEAHDDMFYTRKQIERIVRTAFEAAMKREKKLTSVDKSNVLACSQLWRKVVEEISGDFPEVEYNHLYIDNAAMQMATWPQQFDVLVTGNMFGDILSDLAGALTGSLGLLPSASLNEEGFGMYEPSGGSAPDIAGKGIANPIAQILSVAMMLKYSFDMNQEAEVINVAVEKALNDGCMTGDLLKGSAGVKALITSEMGQAIIDRM